MPDRFAQDFFEIPDALATNNDLREAVLALVQNEPMPGKVLEGGNRLDLFREILTDLTTGDISLDEAYWRTETEIPRHTSPHSSSNRVFPQGWAERQVRTQFSRFYNQAVLERLRDEGATLCFVPHSVAEDASSRCTQLLAGQQQSVDVLYQRLIEAYAGGNWSQEVKIPNHPHCTHVVTPIEE
jgi:hypothetical protein